MNDFAAEPEELRQQELLAVERVLRSGWFILGHEVDRFEKAWSKFCGAKFCVGVGNGMEAIELGLRALDIGPGDEVITTSMTAMGTVLAIRHAGAMPVLADVDLATALLDLESVERCVTPRTKAVLLVHLYGQLPKKIDDWLSFCRNARVHLLEDCAQAHGAVQNGKHAGMFGTWGAFSFYPTKNLGARGDAGALVTDAEEIAARLKVLRNCGSTKQYQHVEAGLNSRLDEMQAAILSTRLDRLERFNTRRKEIAQQYFAGIKNSQIELMSPSQSHVYHLWVVRCAERDRLAEFLRERGIETLIHYPVPVHQQKCGKEIRCDPRGLANAEIHARQCLSLPCHPQLSDDDVGKVIETINQFNL